MLLVRNINHHEKISKWDTQIDFAMLVTVKINFQNIYLSYIVTNQTWFLDKLREMVI